MCIRDRVGKVKYTEMRSYMFEVNEKVVYGVVGVCEIEQIGRPPIKLSLIHI